MAQRVRTAEASTPKARAARPSSQERLTAVLDRLATTAERSSADLRFTLDFLEAGAATIEGRAQGESLPEAERAVWEDLGARFTDRSAVATSRARTAVAFADLLERSIAGDAAMATELGVDRSRVSQRLADGSLYAFAGPDGRHFPRWQLVGGKPLPGLKKVLHALDPDLHPLTVDRWMHTPSDVLEVDGEAVSPHTWLTTGGSVDTLVALAADV